MGGWVILWWVNGGSCLCTAALALQTLQAAAASWHYRHLVTWSAPAPEVFWSDILGSLAFKNIANGGAGKVCILLQQENWRQTQKQATLHDSVSWDEMCTRVFKGWCNGRKRLMKEISNKWPTPCFFILVDSWWQNNNIFLISSAVQTQKYDSVSWDQTSTSEWCNRGRRCLGKKNWPNDKHRGVVQHDRSIS